MPTVADGIAQTAAAMVLEPEVELLFHPDSYGYRPRRSALDAVAACRERCLGEGDHVIVDGTLIPIDWVRADEPYYSMKHRKHGMNVQVIARPDGTPLWFSRATPGRTHDQTAARAHGIVQACLTRHILVLADHAYQDAGATFRAPYHHHREQPERHQQFNQDQARLGAPGERVFAQLKSWRLLPRTRCFTRRIGTIIQALHTADLRLFKMKEVQ
ncbi:hypothetical protein GCM10022295_91050 [Streptomyces osmaniensis]|uniref:DDE Tnp4 domain-containing protein n=1 Tax=Streptomyces osmaniensis TaxID=593134 RepID=A0ABP6Z0J7_9ACTN